MKIQIIDFFSSNPVMALFATLAIFLITIILVAKRWVGFSVAFILLLLSLIVGILVNNPQFFSNYDEFRNSEFNSEQENEFKKTILQALDDVKLEVKTEKQTLDSLKNEINDMRSTLNAEKQKLENYIEESRRAIVNEKTKDNAKEEELVLPESTKKAEIIQDPLAA